MLSFLHYFPLLPSHLQIKRIPTLRNMFLQERYMVYYEQGRGVLNFHLDFGILRQFQAHLFPES